MRAFLACPPEAEWRHRAAAEIDRLRILLQPGGRYWCHPEDLHLTLCFFREISAEQLDLLASLWRQAAATTPPCTLATEGIALFPGSHRPRAMVTVFRRPEALDRLKRNLHHLANRHGVATEKRSFRPHVTLCRLRAEAAPEAVPPLLLPPLELSRLCLYESLGRSAGSGPRYRIRDCFPLSGTPNQAGQ